MGFPDLKIKLGSPTLQVDSLPTGLPGKPKYATVRKLLTLKFICFTKGVTVPRVVVASSMPYEWGVNE